MARLDVRMTQLEQDLRTVTGRLEEVAFQLRRLDERLNKALADMEYRLSQPRSGDASEVGGGASMASAAAPTAGAAGAAAGTAAGAGAAARPPASGPASTGGGGSGETDAAKSRTAPPAAAASVAGLPPREQYARSLGLLEKRSYEDAAAGFSEFLKNNPNDPLADNARYWLGETYYARGDYARSAQLFLDGYEKNKAGPKAPDTLLKLGLSLSALDKKKEACATFRELGKVFPSAPETVRERAAQESKRIACN